jgi:hypothetical protein
MKSKSPLFQSIIPKEQSHLRARLSTAFSMSRRFTHYFPKVLKIVRHREGNIMNQSNSGFGLLQAIVLTALGVSAMTLMSGRVGMMLSSAKKTQARTDIISIRATLDRGVNCAETLLPLGPRGTPCGAGRYIDVRSLTGVLVAQDGSTQIGEWTPMAYCSAAGIDIRAASILPGFRSNLADKQWVGRTLDPTHYRQDPLLKAQRYSYNHPSLQISRPGATGLCADWFTGPGATCTENYYTDASVIDKDKACQVANTCRWPDNLVFQGGQFECRREYSSYIENEIRQISDPIIARNIIPYTLNQLATRVDPGIEEIKVKLDNLADVANFFDVQHNANYSLCADNGVMKCPRGHIMWGYEAFMPMGGHHCRLRCVKLVPN